MINQDEFGLRLNRDQDSRLLFSSTLDSSEGLEVSENVLHSFFILHVYQVAQACLWTLVQVWRDEMQP